jgi:hypothetical protein
MRCIFITYENMIYVFKHVFKTCKLFLLKFYLDMFLSEKNNEVTHMLFKWEIYWVDVVKEPIHDKMNSEPILDITQENKKRYMRISITCMLFVKIKNSCLQFNFMIISLKSKMKSFNMTYFNMIANLIIVR